VSRWRARIGVYVMMVALWLLGLDVTGYEYVDEVSDD